MHIHLHSSTHTTEENNNYVLFGVHKHFRTRHDGLEKIRKFLSQCASFLIFLGLKEKQTNIEARDRERESARERKSKRGKMSKRS